MTKSDYYVMYDALERIAGLLRESKARSRAGNMALVLAEDTLKRVQVPSERLEHNA